MMTPTMRRRLIRRRWFRHRRPHPHPRRQSRKAAAARRPAGETNTPRHNIERMQQTHHANGPNVLSTPIATTALNSTQTRSVSGCVVGVLSLSFSERMYCITLRYIALCCNGTNLPAYQVDDDRREDEVVRWEVLQHIALEEEETEGWRVGG